MQRIVDLKTEPVIGEFYLVPCALLSHVWTPVIGPLHEDREIIGFPHRGLPLDGLPKEKGGVVTCRGHGLRWGKDGKLVPR